MNNKRTTHTDKYYTCMEALAKRFDYVSRQMGLKASNAEEYETWKIRVRAELRHITGISLMKAPPLNCVMLERMRMDGYTREKLLLESEYDVYMPFYVLIPQNPENQRRPVVIAPHGHGSAGKYAPAGRADIPAVADAIAQYNYDYGVQLVREGYMVFCPDARGFGERRESTMQGDEEDKFMSSSCAQLNKMAIPLGLTVTGMWTWDLMRLIDYIETREDCDRRRIGCIGLSGGGQQTLWVTALDDRIKCAVISGYFYGYKQSLLIMSENCSCNYVPHLWEKVDMGDIGALIAPRPLMIETGDQDPLNGADGLKNVLSQIEIAQKAYDILGKSNNLYHYIFKGEHKWCGKNVIPWLKKNL